MTLPSGYWHELTTEDLAEVDPERTVALLPVSAIEQHGPHLPLYTDACIAEGIVAQTLRQLDDAASLWCCRPADRRQQRARPIRAPWR